MSLYEQSEEEDAHHFPSLPAFLVPVEVRDTSHLGEGQKGVFSIAAIQSGTKIWEWTSRVNRIHHTNLETYIAEHFTAEPEQENFSQIQLFLRQGFVLPSDDAFFNSNPTDAGRFMNHSDQPNCGPDGALRDIEAVEELTMCYGFHGNPKWYQDICRKYEISTETEIKDMWNYVEKLKALE